MSVIYWCNKWLQTMWPKATIITYYLSWFLWVSNSDRAQEGWLVSAPWYLEPQQKLESSHSPVWQVMLAVNWGSSGALVGTSICTLYISPGFSSQHHSWFQGQIFRERASMQKLHYFLLGLWWWWSFIKVSFTYHKRHSLQAYWIFFKVYAIGIHVSGCIVK